MTGEETALYDFCDELMRTQAVGDAAYARMVAAFGEKGVVADACAHRGWVDRF